MDSGKKQYVSQFNKKKEKTAHKLNILLNRKMCRFFFHVAFFYNEKKVN